MINRIVDLIVKDIRITCESYRVCSNKCPYAEFCENYYSDEYIDSFSDETIAESVKECIKDDFKRLLKEVL